MDGHDAQRIPWRPVMRQMSNRKARGPSDVVTAVSARDLGVDGRGLIVWRKIPRSWHGIARLPGIVRLTPAERRRVFYGGPISLAAFMKKNDLVLWLSVAWLVALCAIFTWAFLKMTL